MWEIETNLENRFLILRVNVILCHKQSKQQWLLILILLIAQLCFYNICGFDLYLMVVLKDYKTTLLRKNNFIIFNNKYCLIEKHPFILIYEVCLLMIQFY